jgi:hypothetical protein
MIILNTPNLRHIQAGVLTLIQVAKSEVDWKQGVSKN